MQVFLSAWGLRHADDLKLGNKMDAGAINLGGKLKK
jgi:hypothetical protein